MISLESLQEATINAARPLIDGRALTSPQNGALGGRPPILPQNYAEPFLQQLFTAQGVVTLRKYRDTWYRYNGKRYESIAEDDLEAKITDYLQKSPESGAFSITHTFCENLKLNLASEGYCGLPATDYRMPCFLSSRADARDWTLMNNICLNIPRLAQLWSQGLPADTDCFCQPGPNLFTTVCIPYDYDPNAQCPNWTQYLEGVQLEEDSRQVLQMMAGMCISGMKKNVAFFLYGEGGTGKSVFLEIVRALVGEENCCTIPYSRLGERFALTQLTEKRINIMDELPETTEGSGCTAIESTFKGVVSGNEIPVERKGKDPYNARATALMVFASNSLPYISDRSLGTWDRLRIIPFTQRFRGTSQEDPDLLGKLKTELPGIFNWALVGAVMLYNRKNFPECAAGQACKDEHRLSCDHEREFLLERVQASQGGQINSARLYDYYKDWASGCGLRPLSMQKFTQQVKRIFPMAVKRRVSNGHSKITVWDGLDYLKD